MNIKNILSQTQYFNMRADAAAPQSQPSILPLQQQKSSPEAALFHQFYFQCLASVPEGTQRWYLCVKVYKRLSLCKQGAIAKLRVASLILPGLLSLPLFISRIIHCSVPLKVHQIVAVKHRRGREERGMQTRMDISDSSGKPLIKYRRGTLIGGYEGSLMLCDRAEQCREADSYLPPVLTPLRY